MVIECGLSWWLMVTCDDFMVISGDSWNHIPSGVIDPGWEIPELSMKVQRWENHRTKWWNFQQAMFDYWVSKITFSDFSHCLSLLVILCFDPCKVASELERMLLILKIWRSRLNQDVAWYNVGPPNDSIAQLVQITPITYGLWHL